MDGKKFKEKMDNALSKLELVYYDKKQKKFSPSPNRMGHSSFYINFTLPTLSLENLRKFCLLNNFLLAYGGGTKKIEMNVGNIYHINKIKIPRKLIKFKWYTKPTNKKINLKKLNNSQNKNSRKL